MLFPCLDYCKYTHHIYQQDINFVWESIVPVYFFRSISLSFPHSLGCLYDSTGQGTVSGSLLETSRGNSASQYRYYIGIHEPTGMGWPRQEMQKSPVTRCKALCTLLSHSLPSFRPGGLELLSLSSARRISKMHREGFSCSSHSHCSAVSNVCSIRWSSDIHSALGDGRYDVALRSPEMSM